MKQIKFILLVIIVGFIVLFIFQNQEFITAGQSVRLNLYFGDEYHSPEIPNIVLFLICFVAGFIISYFLNLAQRFKANKTIKELKAQAASQLEEISALKIQLESIPGNSPGIKEEINESEKQSA